MPHPCLCPDPSACPDSACIHRRARRYCGAVDAAECPKRADATWRAFHVKGPGCDGCQHAINPIPKVTK